MKKFFITIFPIAVIIATGLIVYWPSRSYEFVYLDEPNLITNRQPYLQNMTNLSDVFVRHAYYPSAMSNLYRPLLTMSFMVDTIRSGSDPRAYHTTNIALHILATIAFFFLLRELGADKHMALFLSLLFISHPLLTQAVSWVPGRNDLLLALFVFSSIWAFLRKKYILHLILFAAALFTKEVAIVLPVASLVVLWAMRARLQKKRTGWFLAISWAAIIVIFFTFRHIALAGHTQDSLRESFSLAVRTFFPGVLGYVGKMLIPVRLTVLPFPADITIWYGLVAVFVLGAAWYLLRKHVDHRLFICGCIWLMAWLLPSFLTIETVTRIVFLEHRAYVPLAGFLMMIFALLKPFHVFERQIGWIASVAIILLCAVLGRFHQPVFKNRESFWQEAAQGSPHLSRAHLGLAVVYSMQGRYQEAVQQHQMAIDLAPTDQSLNNYLGLTLQRAGRHAEAERALLKEIQLHPDYVPAYINLINLYDLVGHQDYADEVYQKAMARNLKISRHSSVESP